MKLTVFCLFNIIYMGCASSELPTFSSFKELDFSYNNEWSSCFSIKFTQSDTVYIRQHFASIRYMSQDSAVKNNASYIGILTDDQRSQLDSFIRSIDLHRYDTSYFQEGLEDGTEYKFYIKNDSLAKSIYIYGDSCPIELAKLAEWLAETRKTLQLVATDTAIIFNSHINLAPPAPVLDIRKFVPPSAEE